MSVFACKTSATLTTVIPALAAPGIARANGDHIHFGTTNISLTVVYGVGGFVAIVVLLFLANWVRYRRAQSRADLPPGPQRSAWDDEEEGG
jgi:hypothetical protein